MRIETPATTLALLLGCSGGGSVVPPWELPYDSDTDAATTTGSEASSTTIGTEPLDTSGSSSTGVWTGDGGSTTEDSSTSSPEVAPEPLPGGGNSDPPSLALHNACGGVEWQRIHGWLLHPHQPPVIGSTDQMERCEERFAGWVTHAADEAGLSRASVYAALAATGHCDEGQPYEQLVQPQSCVLVHPDLDEASCVEAMEASREFAIDTLGAVLSDATAVEFHAYDPPLMAAWLGAGEVRCDADDPWRHPWRLAAPPGYIDRYVAAYNAYKALRSDPPQCAKRIVVSVALYTGLDVPGVNDVALRTGVGRSSASRRKTPSGRSVTTTAPSTTPTASAGSTTTPTRRTLPRWRSHRSIRAAPG